jgi:hypothetical protein
VQPHVVAVVLANMKLRSDGEERKHTQFSLPKILKITGCDHLIEEKMREVRTGSESITLFFS